MRARVREHVVGQGRVAPVLLNLPEQAFERVIQRPIVGGFGVAGFVLGRRVKIG